MRARRTLRFLSPNNLCIALFFLCLFVFWRNGFQEPKTEEEAHHRDHDHHEGSSDGTTTGRWFTRTPPQPQKVVMHPIPELMAEAEAKFKAKLDRQSKTLEEAVEEYKRRYKREPPVGFDDWWDFAKLHGFKMFDEFDILMEDMEPFYQLPGVEVRRRVDQVRGISRRSTIIPFIIGCSWQLTSCLPRLENSRPLTLSE